MIVRCQDQRHLLGAGNTAYRHILFDIPLANEAEEWPFKRPNRQIFSGTKISAVGFEDGKRDVRGEAVETAQGGRLGR